MANTSITKRAIQSAFLELLDQRSLSKITVRDITDVCGINRNTFYYHYQDIPALIEEICSDAVEKIIKEHPSISSIEECIEAGMQFALQHRRAILHIYNSDNRQIYINSLWRMCESTVSTYVNTVFADSPVSDEDKAVIIRYHKCECFGLMVDWMSSGMREDILSQMKRILVLKQGATEEFVRRCVEDYTKK
jgi:AcrR family transcriptional regulator